MEILLLVAGLVLGVVFGVLSQRARVVSAVAAATAERDAAIGERDVARAEAKLLREQPSQYAQTAKAISGEVLAETTKQLREEFEEQRKRDKEGAEKDLQLRTQRIEAMVKPVSEKLDAFQKKVDEAEKQRREVDGEFGERLKALGLNIDDLGKRTTSLVDALKKPSVRGAWGELQLRSVIQRAGMTNYCDFTEQVTTTDDDGRRQRPDVLVRLPGDKLIVVDAKVPLDAFLRAQEAETEEAAEVALTDHARQVKDHIKTLATKRYQDQFDNAPDLVVMFLPNEGIYHGALDADRDLFDFAVDQHVLIATPTTLIALLRAVSYGWSQENLAKNAREIAKAGAELHGRLVDFVTKFDQVGKNINTLAGTYNGAVATLDARLRPKVRELESLEAKSAKQIGESVVVDTQIRESTLVALARSEDAANQLTKTTPAAQADADAQAEAT